VQGLAGVGAVLLEPVARVVEMPNAPEAPGYPRVLMVAAYQTLYSGGDYASSQELAGRALDAKQAGTAPLQGPEIEMDAWSLRAIIALSAGAYADAVAAYSKAAAIARQDGYLGVAANYLSYVVNARVLGGVDPQKAISEARDAVALARQSGMPGAVVQSVHSLALVLAEHDPQQATALLTEGLERGGDFDDATSGIFITGCMVAGRLRDWKMTLALSARGMQGWRWDMSPLWAAIALAECTRAIAETRPEVAAILRGAAYAAFDHARTIRDNTQSTGREAAGPGSNFVLAALTEAGDLVTAALGDERRRQLRIQGAAMTTDEAVSYALANIDPELLAAPIVQRDVAT